MVEDLPAFQLSKSGFYSEGPAFLHNLERDGYQIKEIAGLARTKDASASSVYELLRGVFHDSLTRNEAWFFSIVSSTYDAITRYFGQTAFTVIGDDVKINDYRVNERIQLRPSILIPDNFLTSLLYDIERSTDHKAQIKLIGMFIYLTDGLTDDLMGDKVSNYRRELRKLLG